MENETTIILSLAGVAALCVIGVLVFRLWRIRTRLREVEEALLEIGEGNGNRRLLAKPGDPTASLAYQVNHVVSEYEEELATMRRNDEVTRQLMTSLSHDVRTPLTTLIGYLDAVCKGVVSGDERERYIRTAGRKAYELKEYIDVLFDWFKLNSDEFLFTMEPVEITELTRDILKDWIPVLEENDLAFEVSIPETPCMARLDADAYRRVINNLIQNVVTHSHAKHIAISLEADSQQISIAVSDDGIGISEGDLAHIFDRLYKCDMGRTEKGSGLGLSIVKQIVEKMGGSISAESIPDRKTTFTVHFPSF